MIKVGDIFTSSYSNKEYIVGNHHVGDVLFLHVNNVEKYEGIYLWYDEEEDVKYAKEAFGINLTV